MPGGFSFNQYLVVDDEPLLFHTGPRGLFPLVTEAIASVLPVYAMLFITPDLGNGRYIYLATAFWVIVAAMAGLLGGMVAYFRNRGWL